MLDERYYSIKEIAEMFNVSISTVRNLCDSGEMEHIKIGSQYRISEKNLNKYINKNNSKGE